MLKIMVPVDGSPIPSRHTYEQADSRSSRPCDRANFFGAIKPDRYATSSSNLIAFAPAPIISSIALSPSPERTLTAPIASLTR